MSDLRKIFETKDFVINTNIIKSINHLDINLDEFLLLLYFINISCNLNTEDIKEKLGFDEDKIVSTFTSLVNKKFIEMVVTNNNGEVLENYSPAICSGDAFVCVYEAWDYEYEISKHENGEPFICFDEQEYLVEQFTEKLS